MLKLQRAASTHTRHSVHNFLGGRAAGCVPMHAQLTFSAVHATAAVVTTRQGLLRVWHTQEHYRAPAPALRSNLCLRL